MISKIMDKCHQMQGAKHAWKEECEVDYLLENLRQMTHKQIQDVFKEIELAEASTLKVLYQYKVQSRYENEDNALEVQKEYKSGIMDPSRVAAQFEKLMNVKKLIGRKKLVHENAISHE